MDKNISYTKIPKLDGYIKSKLNKLNQAGFFILDFREIPYGVQIHFKKDLNKYIINFYYTDKNGLKIVSNINNDETESLANIFEEYIKSSIKEKQKKNVDYIDFSTLTFKRWIGTDESGKGDYFGPLVTAGFVMSKDMEEDLIKLNIKDSKKLSDKQIGEIANRLNEYYRDSISICEISPQKYNELYNKLTSQGKKLNSLLAWAHARVIENLLIKHSDIDGAIADQFGNESFIKGSLQSRGKAITLIQRPKAEENLAVAAASILARNRFVEKIKSIEEKYGVSIPKGAGPQVILAGREIVSKFGIEELSNAAKLHFKTTHDVLNGKFLG